MPKKSFCNILLFTCFFNFTKAQLINASFLAVDTICINQTYTVQNTSTGTISTYYWSICGSTVAAATQTFNLGNPGGSLNTPAHMTINKDGSNYYAFVTNNSASFGTISRLSFGNSLNNTPVGTNLGTLGNTLPTNLEDIYITKEGANWYGVTVGGSGSAGSLSTFTFGLSLANTPTAVSRGNIGSLSYPTPLQIFQSGGNIYGFTVNRTGNTITRFSFGNSISNVPTGTNLGNIGSFNLPSQMCFINYLGNWYAFVCNDGNSTLTRLDFGSSLLNTPTGTNIGNPNGILAGPRGIFLDVQCDAIRGMVGNRSNNTLANITMTAGASGVMSISAGGNITPISFPQTLYKQRIGDTSSVFVVNVTGNTISRIDYPTCNARPSSTLQNPPPVTFTAAGTYTVNLVCNEGLYNQSRFCRKIVVLPAPPFTVSNSGTLCLGATLQLSVVAGSSVSVFQWAGPNSFTSGISNVNIPNSGTVHAGNYSVQIANSFGCSNSSVIPISYYNDAIMSVGSLTLCSTGPGTLTASGAQTYTWFPGALTGTTFTASPVSNTTYTVVGTHSSGCTSTAMPMITAAPARTLIISPLTPTACTGGTIIFTANASGGFGGNVYAWTGGPITASYAVNQALPGTYNQTVVVTDVMGCSTTATNSVVYYDAVFLNTSSIAICPGSIGTLTVTGANSYTWFPSGFQGSSFTVSPTVATVYCVSGTSTAGCFSQLSTTVTIRPSPTLFFSTFSITCGSLGSATLNSSSGTGPFSYTWTPTSQTNTVATGLFPGNYTLTVADAGTGCVFTPTVYFAPLVPLTGTVAASNSLICNGVPSGTASIALSGGSGNQSYAWTDMNGVQTNPGASGLAAGVNTVFVSDALTFCSVTHTFLITQPPAFTLNIASSSPSVCLGDSISFTATNFGGTPAYSYTWAGQAAGNSLVVKENLPGTFVYSVSSSDSYSCSVSRSTSVLFVPNPTVSVSSVSICPLQQAVLFASGAGTYSWSTGLSGNVLAVSPSVTTGYSVVGSALSCSTMASASVVLYSTPSPSIISNSPVCEGDSLGVNAVGGVSFLWSGPQSFTSISQSFGFPGALPPKSGNYTLKVSSVQGCTATVSRSLTVHPTPLLVAGGGTVCEGSTLSLYSSFLNGGSRVWNGPGFFSTLQSPQLPNANLGMNGTYSVTLTSAVGCTNMASVSGSVVSLPLVSVLGDSALCAGKSLQLSGSGGGSYLWTGPNGFYSQLQNPGITAVSALSAGLYSLQVTFGPCQQSAVHNLTVHPLPLPLIQSNSPVCENNALQLSTASGQTFTWTGPGGYSLNAQTALISSASLSNSGVYTLNLYDVNSCTGSATVFVNVLPAPLVSANNASVCFGSALSLSVSGGVSYLWNGPANYTALGNPVFIPIVNSQNTGIYSVFVTGSNSCSTTSTLSVTGFPFNLPVPIINAPLKSCLGSSVTLSASTTLSTGASGATLYEWWGPSGFHSTLSEVSFQASDSSVAGIYTLSVRNQNNCLSTSTVPITLYPLPTGTIYASHNSLCVPFCSQFKLHTKSSTGPLVFSSYNLGKEVFNGAEYFYCFKDPGEFLAQVSFRDSNNCVNSSTLIVHAFEKPRAGFDHTPVNPLAGIDEIHFYNTSTGSDLESWVWFLKASTSDTLREKDPLYMYSQAGLYPVTMIVKNAWGCADTIIQSLLIEEAYNLYIPDAFTPNADGLNEVFIPKGQGIKNYQLQIFDRGGELIFHTTDLYTGWDGKRKDNLCKVDAYIWKIELRDNAGKAKTLSGKVNLIR